MSASIAHALHLVTSIHLARLSDATLGTAESLARQAGATHTQIAAAVARSYE